MSFTALPAGSDPTVIPTGVSPTQHFAVGFPLAPLPVFTATVESGTLAVTVGGTDEDPILEFVIPPGTPGTNGISCFTSLTTSFVQPAPGGLVTVTVAETAWMTLGNWVFIAGGGWYIIASNPLSSTQIILRNPGTAELTPLWGTPPVDAPWSSTWFIPFNAVTGATITSSGFSNQVVETGIPGTRGAQGESGLSPQITVVQGVPVPGAPTILGSIQMVTNGPIGGNATSIIPYGWNGATWIPIGANFAGLPGTQTFFQATDPNILPITGSNIGDGNWSVTPGGMTLYQKTTLSAWITVGSVPFGVSTAIITHNSAGVETLDLSYGAYAISFDKDMELDWTDSAYAGAGNWTATLVNTDGGSLDLTFTSGRWMADPILGIMPLTTVLSGETVIIKWVRDAVSGLMVITNFFIPESVEGS